MKHFFTTILFIGGCIFLLSSCAKKITSPVENGYAQKELPPHKEFNPETDKLPQFPGGEAALLKFISSNLVYPASAVRKKIQGRVVVYIVIDTDGSISDIEVLESVEPSLDKAAIKVIKKMPKWEPGERNGEKVRVSHTVPIVFRLS